MANRDSDAASVAGAPGAPEEDEATEAAKRVRAQRQAFLSQVLREKEMLPRGRGVSWVRDFMKVTQDSQKGHERVLCHQKPASSGRDEGD